MQAPSAANQQAWNFIVVKGKENLEKLSKYNPYGRCIQNANAAVIVLGNKNKMILPEHWEQDLGAASQNILLEATELELGSVWIGTFPYEDRIEYIQNLYKLEKNLIPYSVIALGYPKSNTQNYYIDRYIEENVIYID